MYLITDMRVRNLTKIEKSAMKILIQLWNLQDFHQVHSDLSHGNSCF